MPIIEKLDGFVFERSTASEVKEKLERDEVVLIDVRTPQEYALEYIVGAMLFPMFSFDPRKLPLQGHKPIVFYCRSGKRSRTVAEKCGQIGVSKIAHMDGGFNAWKEACYPYIAMDAATGRYIKKHESASQWYSVHPPIEQGKSNFNAHVNAHGSISAGPGRDVPQSPGEIASFNSSSL
ncbi:MAG: rhodanese-like domain-containing protein [Elainellaceae cyanobacterium]